MAPVEWAIQSFALASAHRAGRNVIAVNSTAPDNLQTFGSSADQAKRHAATPNAANDSALAERILKPRLSALAVA